jgi:cytochrome c oxidase accessory protein FixG
VNEGEVQMIDQSTSTEPKAEEFRDRLATIDKQGKRVWVYPQKPKGRLYNSRTLLSVLYLVVLFGLPFIHVNGHPLFLFDITHRKFILFGQIFWPQDFFIFAVGMLLFIVFVALFTVVFGRVFCGWICPQTIFMEMVFRKIEYWIEGDAPHQKMLDKAPWNGQKIFKKVSKWISFWALSFIIANTFLAYIIGLDELKKIAIEPLSQHVGGFAALLLFTSVFFGVYLRFREQVCTVVCPYGRLQGVLLDKNSILVAYDYKRGEQRGKFRKNQDREIGDCIDCYQCVKVCPTGIDIRNGTQMECVNCTACIDICNSMMDAVGLPPNLIRMASENSIENGKQKFWTKKVIAYVIIMILLLSTESYLLVTRSDVSANLLRASGQLFQEQADGQISNLYNYKLINKTYADKEIVLKPENFKGEIRLIGNKQLKVTKESDASGQMFILLRKEDVHLRNTELSIGVWEGAKKLETIKTSFLGPFRAE